MLVLVTSLFSINKLLKKRSYKTLNYILFISSKSSEGNRFDLVGLYSTRVAAVQKKNITKPTAKNAFLFYFYFQFTRYFLKKYILNLL